VIYIRCNNLDNHRHDDDTEKEPGEGNILAFVNRDSVYVMCKNGYCKRWTEIQFRFPGTQIDLTKAAITQRLLPRGTRFPADRATTVIEDMT
jgi:hypothetical protein